MNTFLKKICSLRKNKVETPKIPFKEYDTTKRKQNKLKKNYKQETCFISKYTMPNGDTIYFQGTYEQHQAFMIKHRINSMFY